MNNAWKGCIRWLPMIVPASSSAAGDAVNAVSPLSITSLGEVIFSLCAVILCMFAGSWLVRRSGVFSGTSGKSVIKIVSSISIGTRERIALVRVRGKDVLVGISPGNIQALCVMEESGIEEGSESEAVFSLEYNDKQNTVRKTLHGTS